MSAQFSPADAFRVIYLKVRTLITDLHIKVFKHNKQKIKANN